MTVVMERRPDRANFQPGVPTLVQPDNTSMVQTTTQVSEPRANDMSPNVAVTTQVVEPRIPTSTILPFEAQASNADTRFDALVSRMVAENTENGKIHGKIMEPLTAIYLGSQAVEKASLIPSVLHGIGFMSLGMGIKSILSRAIFGRKAQNAARLWVNSNAERGWGPFKFIHRVATAPARFLSNLSFNPKIFKEIGTFSGTDGDKNIASLSPKRANDLAAYGLAAGSIYKSAEVMAPDGLDTKGKLGHLVSIAEIGKSIFDKTQAKIAPENRQFWAESIKQHAQIVEDALYTTARTGYIMGTNVLLGAAAWTWNVTGRSFGIFEKGWNEKIAPAIQSVWNGTVELFKNITSKATELFNSTVNGAQSVLNPR